MVTWPVCVRVCSALHGKEFINICPILPLWSVTRLKLSVAVRLSKSSHIWSERASSYYCAGQKPRHCLYPFYCTIKMHGMCNSSLIAMHKSQSARPYWSKSLKLNEDNWVRESSDSGFLLATNFSAAKSEYWDRTSNTKPDITWHRIFLSQAGKKSSKFISCEFTLTLPAAVYILPSLKRVCAFHNKRETDRRTAITSE